MATMNFKGGTILIGSLLWDSDKPRVNWRTEFLENLSNKVSVPLKIRYGRQSISRKNTYTMILSNHPTTESGQGYIAGFKHSIETFSDLEKQAFALAKAEGIYKNEDKRTLNSSWGTVGLLINPLIEDKNIAGADLIRENWANLYRNFNTFMPSDYQIADEDSIIDSNGFLKIEWKKEMDSFDFLIATPTVPNPKRLLSADDIADKMRQANYRIYFDNNKTCKITTFQDNLIDKYLETSK